ncbi:hypothetical protein R1sor_007185 [Riccia sorocarpa]|uniref:histone deacetylase n=1 Tax=Riccia sorocarpa TaxID=122646 RepID=A0ABD3HSG4_9MARC
MGPEVGLVYDERMCEHANQEDPHHPEKPQRITAIFERLLSAGIVDRCKRVPAREATDAELASVHTSKHIAAMRAVSKQAYDREERINLARRYNSIYFNKGSTLSSLLAAGSVVELASRVAQGEIRSGAAVVRPPGHHAESDAAMGFCLFNNVAVAAHVLAHGQPSLGGVKKVLIVDWDVHHGNGTQHMFWQDPQVLYLSVHRYDDGFFYPGSEDGDLDKVGEGAGLGFNVNVPWPRRGYGDQDYLAVFDYVLMPIAHEFQPDLVLVSGGFDSARGDPLGGCQLTPAGYHRMTQRLMELAGGRVILALEGGYNLSSISESYLACMKALLGESYEEKVSAENSLLASTWSLIKEVRKHLRPFWPSMSKEEEEDLDRVPEYFVVHDDTARISSSSESEHESEGDVFEDLGAFFSDLQVEEISGDGYFEDEMSLEVETRTPLIEDLINHLHLNEMNESPVVEEPSTPVQRELDGAVNRDQAEHQEMPVPVIIEEVKRDAKQDPSVPVIVEVNIDAKQIDPKRVQVPSLESICVLLTLALYSEALQRLLGNGKAA